MIDLLNKNSLIQKCTKQHNMAVGGFNKSKIHVDSHSDWAFFYNFFWCTCRVRCRLLSDKLFSLPNIDDFRHQLRDI